jgi:hypothetical protein
LTPAVIERVAAIDLAADANEALFSWLEINTDLKCQFHAIIEVAGRMDARAYVSLVGDFCSSAAKYGRFLSDVGCAQVRKAYDPSIHFAWLMGLRVSHIDIRYKMRGMILEYWSFAQPRRDAETLHFYLFLTNIDKPGVYQKISATIAATAGGNDATSQMKSFAELRTPQARDVLMTYANDLQQAKGPETLELAISATIKLLLSRFY